MYALNLIEKTWRRLEECYSDVVSEIQRECVFPEVVPTGVRDFDDLI